MLRRLLAAIRRFFARRAAQKLLALQLPKGLPAPARPFSPELPEPPPGEYWTVPLYRKQAKKLFRLAALPKPLCRLDVVREPKPRPLHPEVRLPRRLEIAPPLESPVVELGVARPAALNLDAELRLPVEVEPLKLPSDAPPPAKERKVRPRTPLARAPLSRVKARNFRLDPRSLQPANEGIVPLEPRDTTYRWVRPAFRRRWLDLPWMAQERIRFLGPLQYEWFLMWWDAWNKRRPGAREPYDYDLAPDLDFALEAVKEQMLIRRDVKKDENPPEEQQFYFVEVGVPMAQHEGKLPPLPEKQWIGADLELPPVTVPRMAREAYLQWRTLVDALEER